jgi:hypothetical protein
MDVPQNLDGFLADLLRPDNTKVVLADEDRQFLERILASIETGSKGIFVVLHPNDRMQYMLLNTDRTGAVSLLAKVLARTADAIVSDSE